MMEQTKQEALDTNWAVRVRTAAADFKRIASRLEEVPFDNLAAWDWVREQAKVAKQALERLEAVGDILYPLAVKTLHEMESKLSNAEAENTKKENYQSRSL